MHGRHSHTAACWCRDKDWQLMHFSALLTSPRLQEVAQSGDKWRKTMSPVG